MISSLAILKARLNMLLKYSVSGGREVCVCVCVCVCERERESMVQGNLVAYFTDNWEAKCLKLHCED